MRCSLDQCAMMLDMVGGYAGAAIIVGVCVLVVIVLEQVDKK